MAPDLSWIDRERLKSLVEQTAWRPPPPPERPKPEADDGHSDRSARFSNERSPAERSPAEHSPGGPAPARTASLRRAAAPTRERADVPPPPPFAGQADDGLASFVDWALDATGLSGALVADARGHALQNRGGGDREVHLVRALDACVRQLDADAAGYLVIEQGDRHALAAWADGGAGRGYAVVFGDRPPREGTGSAVARGLAQALRSQPRPKPRSRGARVLEHLGRAVPDAHGALLRVSLQTGLPMARLRTPEKLSEAEVARVEASVRRILQVDRLEF